VALPEATALPASPGFFKVPVQVTAGDEQFAMTVGLFLPPAYFQDPKPFPVVMMLHNKGLEGGHGDLGSEGLAALCSRDDWDWRTLNVKPGDPPPPPRIANQINLRTDARFIGIAPHCPKGMVYTEAPMPAVLAELVTQVEKAYRTDQDRVYLTGFSYGGTCAWMLAEQMPSRCAAVVAISSRATEDPARTAAALKDVGVYVACGTNEWSPPYCRKMRDALVAGGHAKMMYREIEGGTHWCYPIVYTDPQFWEWLFAQRRTRAGAATRP
jgi:predicted peptidase